MATVAHPSRQSVDVAIVGGGIAGSSLGAALAASGFGVVVVEREARFRDRVRGESLHPWGAAEADRLGLIPVLRAAGARPLPIWQRYADRLPLDPFRWAEVVPGGHVEWAVPHPALQEAMLAHAASNGATVLRPARVTAHRPTTRHRSEIDIVDAAGSTAVTTRLLVGADGARSAVRRWIGATMVEDPTHHAIGGGLLDGIDLDDDSTHQAHPPGAMVVLFPRGNGRARAYLVCAPAEAAAFRGPNAAADFITACAASLPEPAMRAAKPAGPVSFFSAADVQSTRLNAPGVVLVGDAAGATDPSQGHGLSLAFRDARELAELLRDESDWSRATPAFAEHRQTYVAPLREHARWAGLLTIDRGPDADARRHRVASARDVDPTAGGYAGIYAFGPDGLVPDDAARRHFFGEDLPTPLRPAP